MKIPAALSFGTIALMTSLMAVRAESVISSAQIRACIPRVIGRQFIDSFSPLGSTKYRTDTYIMVSVTARNGEMSPPSQFPMILKFEAPDQECSIPFLDPMGDRISYSAEVPEAVAHALMLQQWKLGLKQFGGKRQYEDYLAQLARQNNGVLELNRDEFWAFQQLGFKLPDALRVKVLPR